MTDEELTIIAGMQKMINERKVVFIDLDTKDVYEITSKTVFLEGINFIGKKV